MGSWCCSSRKPDPTPTSKVVTLGQAEAQLLNAAQSEVTFEKPAKLINIAGRGGTSGLFRLVQKGGPPPESAGEPNSDDVAWVGKEIGDSFPEIVFYEKAGKCIGKKGWDLLDFTIPYNGVLVDFPCKYEDGTRNVNLLVLQDFTHGMELPRCIDFKIGHKTAEGDWKGKSQWDAWRQNVIDNMTNTSNEFMRVEGLTNAPGWYLTEEAILLPCGRLLDMIDDNAEEKLERFRLQQLDARTALAALVDLTEPSTLLYCDEEEGVWEPGDRTCLDDCPYSDDEYLRSSEMAEQVLLSITKNLKTLRANCEKFKVPQKWIGSSIAIAVDLVTVRRDDWNAALSLERETGEEYGGPHTATVHILDWGRSDLSSKEDLKRVDRADWMHNWETYKMGVLNLLMNASFLYWNNMCVTEWAKIKISIFDYDFNFGSGKLFVGGFIVDLPATGFWTGERRLLDKFGNTMVDRERQNSAVKYTISYLRMRDHCRFKGVWRVHLKHAKSIAPRTQGIVAGGSHSCDPVATVEVLESAESAEAAGIPSGHVRKFIGRTSVERNEKNPQWDHRWEIPVARTPQDDEDPEDTDYIQSNAGWSALQSVLIDTSVVCAPTNFTTTTAFNDEASVFDIVQSDFATILAELPTEEGVFEIKHIDMVQTDSQLI